MPEDKSKRVVINSTDADDNDVTVEVVRPTAQHLRDAQLAYNRAFRDALESGALLRQKLEDEMRRQKIWDDEKQTRYEQINKDILASERKLKAGGIKLREARDVAMEMRNKRMEFRELISERSSMDGNTAEGQADNARFNHLASVCIVKEGTNVTYFTNMDEYEDGASNPFVVEAAGQLANMMYGLDPSYEKNLPENKFLTDYKFADSELRLLNSDGHPVDEEGRLINENGNFVDKDGNLVDIEGNPVDEEGEYIVDSKPFLDDDGKPVVAETEEDEEDSAEEEPKAKKKKATKKAKEEVESETEEVEA